MKHITVLFLLVLLTLGLVPVFAQQTESDFDRLMAGETVELDWGDGEIVLTDNLLFQPLPPAGDLLRDFLFQMVVPDEEETNVKIGLDKLFGYMAPVTIDTKGHSLYGTSAVSMAWNSSQQELIIQTGRYMPPSPDFLPPCGGGYYIWDTVVDHCFTDREHDNGAEVMPTTISYRGNTFTVIFLPPNENQ
jgi:hypothetical protein